ncbi:MAG: hypothetical protein IKK30_06745 [Clostridia bacterium]|nr:hypothetical protein [Clostridia bacterium]
MDNKVQNYSFLICMLRSLSIAMALIMLDTPMFIISIITLLVFSPALFPNLVWLMIYEILYSLARPVLYIWALVITIGGEQDVVAIIFYILFAVQIFSMIKNLIFTLANLMASTK